MSVRLEVRELKKAFVRHDRGAQRLEVLRGVDLDLEPGTFTVIRGPSGSGKSSLLRCIYGTYRPTDGSVVVHSEGALTDLTAIPERRLLSVRARCMAMASQFLQVIPRVSAVDLVAAEGPTREEAADLLLSLGLPRELLDLPPASFSGGERQLVNLAITVASPRGLLLLDEVTASLDPQRRSLVLGVLAKLKESGVTMLAVFHDLPDRRGLIDSVLEMREGRVAA